MPRQAHNPMKTLRALFLAAALVLAVPAFALDPHDSQIASVSNVTLPVSPAAATVTSIVSLTSHAVNSGTNSYYVFGNVRYSGPLGNSVHIQLYKTVSGTTTVLLTKTIRGDGDIQLTTQLESVAASTTLGIAILQDVAGLPQKIDSAVVTILGLAGNTQ